MENEQCGQTQESVWGSRLANVRAGTDLGSTVFAHIVPASVCWSIKFHKRPTVLRYGSVESLGMRGRGQFGYRRP